MRRTTVAALGLLLLNGVVAFAQEDLPELPVQETVPQPAAAVTPAPPAGSFGVWRGPAAMPDKPPAKGFEPFYVRSEWNQSLGIDPVVAFAFLGDYLVTCEGKRDAKTRVADYSHLFLMARRGADKFARREQYGDGKPFANTDAEHPPLALFVASGVKYAFYLATQTVASEPHRLTAGSESGTVNVSITRKTVTGDSNIPVATANGESVTVTAFPLHFYEWGNQVRFLTRARSGVVANTFKLKDESGVDSHEVIPDTLKKVSLSVRTFPVSAACIGEFAGDRKQIVAALGSVANGPVAFAGLRSQSSLPDTEEESAPGIIAAWRVPGRPLPFLVTARNTGAEEGTDTPEGRVVLSLWHAGEARWMSVWESGALGKKIIAVATDETVSGVTKLLVLCEDADGTSRLVCLSPIMSSDAPKNAP